MALIQKTGHYLCDGDNSTPNLVDKYLKGAGTDADAGGTGGSTTNIHDIDHSHTVSHAHASATSPAPALTRGSKGNDVWLGHHTHSVSLNASTTGTGTTQVELTTSETVQPAYTKLLTIQNRAGDDTRAGVIALWLGDLADIPYGWVLCDGNNDTTDMRGRHLKSTATVDVGRYGGSNTHTHASQGHAHSNISHSHTANPSTLTHDDNLNRDSNGTSRSDKDDIQELQYN